MVSATPRCQENHAGHQLHTVMNAAEPGEGYGQLAQALADVLVTDPDAGPR